LDFLRARPFAHLSTFGGADIGCRVALEVFRVIDDEHLLENATQRGEQFRSGFERLRAIYPELVAEVRGRGLMLALRYTEGTLGEQGYRGRLVLIGDEPELPFGRPPLSKTYLRGEEDLSAWRVRPASWYAQHDVELRIPARVQRVDTGAQHVLLDSGERVD